MMKENFLFREDPQSAAYEAPQPVVNLPVPAENLPVPAGYRWVMPIHGTSLTLGILALALFLLVPLISVILGIIGRISGERHRETHNIVAGKICCNVAFILTGLQYLLIFLQLLSNQIFPF